MQVTPVMEKYCSKGNDFPLHFDCIGQMQCRKGILEVFSTTEKKEKPNERILLSNGLCSCFFVEQEEEKEKQWTECPSVRRKETSNQVTELLVNNLRKVKTDESG